jgi:alkylation response protein AidB-like acyl-CoA dehydrogenase
MSVAETDASEELVMLPAEDDAWAHVQRAFLEAARSCNGRTQPLVTVLEGIEPTLLAPQPGAGHTVERFKFLAAVAGADVTAARVLEPHLDAIAILGENHQFDARADSGQTWGVFASEGPSSTLVARQESDAWTLTGTKPWCSLGGRLSRALVTARTIAGEPRLFRVDLRQCAVRSPETLWVARGLADVESGPLVMDAASATAVGDTGWYLDRPGFRWGGIGVAACWWGGCVPLFAAIVQKSKRGEAKPLTASRIGRLYRALESARLLLERSAAYIDRSHTGDTDDTDRMAVLAHTVRGVVVDALDETLAATRDILGPAALALDEATARRCADLEIYASQYHRGGDDVSLSSHLESAGPWW